MRNINTILCIACALLITTALWASPSEKHIDTEKLTAAVKVARTAPYFGVGGIGFTGQISEGEEALHTVIKSKDKQLLMTLAQDRNEVSRLYALLALRYLNNPEYKPLAESLLKSKARVETFSGCLRASENVADIAGRIVKGDYNQVLTFDAKRLEKQKQAKLKQKGRG